MVRDLLFKVALLVLLVLAALVFGRGIVFGQVTVDVSPKAALENPYKRTTFRFRWAIEPSPDNRRYAISCTCGSEIYSAQREMDGESPKTSERFIELKVLEDCSFVACVVKVIEGKAKTICSQQIVHVLKGEPP